MHYFVCGFFIVRMNTFISTIYHIHPNLSFFNQALVKSFSRRAS